MRKQTRDRRDSFQGISITGGCPILRATAKYGLNGIQKSLPLPLLKLAVLIFEHLTALAMWLMTHTRTYTDGCFGNNFIAFIHLYSILFCSSSMLLYSLFKLLNLEHHPHRWLPTPPQAIAQRRQLRRQDSKS